MSKTGKTTVAHIPLVWSLTSLVNSVPVSHVQKHTSLMGCKRSPWAIYRTQCLEHFPAEGKCYISVCYCLSELRELLLDREAWRAAIHGVEKSRTRLSDWSDLIWLLSWLLNAWVTIPTRSEEARSEETGFSSLHSQSPLNLEKLYATSLQESLLSASWSGELGLI